jgi:anti-anti-sigma factor
MNITTESYGHAVILLLKGEFGEDDLGAIRQAVEHQLEADEVVDIVFNLAEVPFIDSAGLEYLLDLQDRLAERFGQVKLVCPDENVAQILEFTRLRSTFEVYKETHEAVKSVSA